MGKLLANVKAREKLIKVVSKYGFVLSVASYVIGIIWMILLPHHELSARNYFSENQLLPGLVDTYFALDHYTHSTYTHLQHTCVQSQSHVKQKIKTEFTRLGFDVYEQNFEVPSKFINGSNVYGIFRSPRASGVESIILNVPLHAGCNSSGSLALMLGIANYFREQTYWAKDIIFVVTEHELYGMQAWLNGYFRDHSAGISAENLLGHGGSIQAAVTLDLPLYFVKYIDILYEGSNGLLPNLDFINLVTRIANMEGVPSKFKYQTQLFQSKEDYVSNIETLVHMMATQASGYPTGNHGMFFKYRIEAVTIQGMNTPMSRYKKEVHFVSLGRMVEGIFRSVNNMLEHFHQSFFLYVLPNTFMYISIGMYMPPLGCLLLPLLIHLAMLWIKIFHLQQQQSIGNEEKIPEGDVQVQQSTEKGARESRENLQQFIEKHSEISTHSDPAESNIQENTETRIQENTETCIQENTETCIQENTETGIQGELKANENVLVTMCSLLDGGVLQHMFLSYATCMSCYHGFEYYFDNITYYSPSEYHLLGVLMVSCYTAVLLVSITHNFTNSADTSLKFFALLHLAVLIILVSILNFSAAFVLATFYVPLAISVTVKGGKVKKLFQFFFSLISSPPILIWIICVDSQVLFHNFDMERDFLRMLPTWKRVIVEAHLNQFLFIWTKDLFYFAVLPIWVALSSIY